MPRGHGAIPADEAGRVLDRLAGLEKVISPELIRQALVATGRVDSRACGLSHEVVLRVVLAMGLFTDAPIRQVFKLCRRLRPGEPSPHRSSLCVARKRLGPAPVRRLLELVARPLARPDTPGAFAFGLRLMGIDGTVLDVPDSAANARAFGRPSGPRGEGAFPQVRKLSLVELGTHAEVALVVGTIRRGERSMVAGLLRHLGPGMLLMLDQGFFSGELWRRLAERGIDVLARVTTQVSVPRLATLPDGSFLSKIYKNDYDRRRDRGGIVVRVVRYTLDDPRRVGCGEEHVLMTTLLDADRAPAEDLIMLYHERWEHELTFDEQKTHQDPRRATKTTPLRSETPAGVVQEIHALSLAHFAIRSLMFEAAATKNMDTDRLSFTGCFQILKCRLPECDPRTPETFASWYDGLLEEMRAERVDPRRNRINPRVIKKPSSNWKRARPEHRRLPPLEKTFEASIVILR